MPLPARLVPALIALELAVLAAWWRPALIPLAVLVVALPTARRRGRRLSQWIAIRSGWRDRRRAGWDRGGPAGALARLTVTEERDRYGRRVAVIDDERGSAAILALDPPTLLNGTGPTEPPWSALTDLLADPVRPAAVQLVADPNGRSWLALRVDPECSADAVARRGGGTTGRRRAVHALAQRAATALTDAGLPATPLGSDDARTVLAATTRAAQLSGAAETWRGWNSGEAEDAPEQYFLAGRAISGWTSVTLFPDDDPAKVKCRILMRGDGGSGGVRLDGQHGPASLAAAPLAMDAAELGPPLRLDRSALPNLLGNDAAAMPTIATTPATVTTTRTGSVPLGYDRTGELRVALLHRSVPTDVVLVGGPTVATLLIRRAAAATVIVTTRPEAWSELGDQAELVAPGTEFSGPGSPVTPGLVLWDRILPSTPARSAWSASVVLAHRLSADLATQFAAQLGLSDRQAGWLARGPEDGLAVVDGEELLFLALGAQPVEAASGV
jgi:hypothetical protein